MQILQAVLAKDAPHIGKRHYYSYAPTKDFFMHFADVQTWLCVAISVLLSHFAPQPTCALTLDHARDVKDPVSLSGHLSVFHDPSAAFAIEDIVSGGAQIQFETIPTMLTEGYQKGAIWVRFSLSAPEGRDQWLLEIERPLIEQVTLYTPDETGQFSASPPGDSNGEAVGGVRAYPALFPITVPSTEDTYYMRFQSTTSITTALFLWQEEGYEKKRRFDDWMIGIMIGAIGAMMIANLLYAFNLRDLQYLLYSAVLLESGLLSIFHNGYAADILYFLSHEKIHRLWGCIVCLYSIVMIFFLSWIFDFRRHNNWIWRFFQGIVLLNAAAFLLSAAGRYGDVGLFVSRLQQLSYIFIIGYAAHLIIAKQQRQYLLPAISFMGVIAVSFVMQMQYTGANPFLIDGSLSRVLAMGTLFHLILLSMSIANRAQLAERSLQAEKDRVIAISQAAERALTTKVRERTAELSESNLLLRSEIEHRRWLEAKLNQSLESVNKALAQQKDFVAMVSHEFRAPLAVIAAAADNLRFSASMRSNDIRLRIEKIGRTVKRMSMLVENILAGDRVDAGWTSPAMVEVFDLNEVLHAVEAGLDYDAAKRVNSIGGDVAMVRGDRLLLEIVVQNLIQNALKYSAATDVVTVELSVGDDMAFINVTDLGNGVAPSDHDLIFMKYYRNATAQGEKGTGLGLYISREIAQMSDGNLVLSASNENGSTFCLSLPIEASPSR